MTRLLITIDRGPDAKAGECGICRFADEDDLWCQLHPLFDSHGFGHHTPLSTDPDYDDVLLRCNRCLEAEREARVLGSPSDIATVEP